MKKVKLKYKSVQVLPQTVCDAVLDNRMQRSLTELLDDKLSATEADTAEAEITFASGLIANGVGVTATKVDAPLGDIKQLTSDKITTDHIESADYDGVTSGFKLAIVDGDSYLEVDKLSVRKNAIFTELDIKSLKHIGGAILLSPASCKITSVEEIKSGSTITGYKCYFLATDGEETINNEWAVGDQAICNKYNITKLHHYWRLVTAVSSSPINGYHYVILSKTDCDDFSNVPQAGDEIVCLGNRNDVDRQCAIFLNSEGADAPSLLQLDGINSYSLESENIITQLSKSRNIIRGQQVEVITESGNKSVKQFADEALADANSYSDGIGNALKEFVGDRETYLQAQITQNAGDITLKANKSTVDAIEGRVSNAEAKIQVNAGNINLKADKTTVDVIDGRVSKAEADIQVNSDGLSSVVSKQEKVGVEYSSSDFKTGKVFTYYGTRGDYAVIDESETDYKYLRLGYNEGIRRGDKIHIENLGGFLDIIIGDTDRGGATSDYSQESGLTAIDHQKIDDGIMYCDGFLEYYSNHDGEETVDLIVDDGTGYGSNIYIALSDDNPTAYQSIKVTLIKSAYTAESRIRQTADEIELKVGNTGINLDKKQITLSAANTVVKGDLSVQRVMTYYEDGSVRSAYNGNGNGTIVYYYKNGNKMREDVFIYDAKGNATGMATIYYNADGTVSWKLTQNGFETTLSDYWTYEEGMAYTSTISEVRKAIAAYKTSGSIDLPTSVFSTFVATSGSLNQSYSGRVVQGRVATSALPKPQTPYTGYYFDPSPMQRVAEQGSSAVVMFFRVKYVNAGRVESITDYDVI